MTLPGLSVPGPEKNEEIEGIVSALDLPIFQNFNPAKLYILLPTKQTLTSSAGLLSGF